MSSYWQIVADAVAHWPLQDASGTTASDTAGSNPAALSGGLSFDANSVAGATGWLPTALHFDGVNDLVRIPSQADLGLGEEHSYALWWRADDAPPWNAQALIETGGTVHGSVVHLQGGSVYFLTSRDNAIEHTSATPPADGLWRHVAAVHRGATLELFLDGVLQATEPVSASWVQSGVNSGALGAVDTGLWVSGSSPSGVAAFFKGALAGVQLYARALTAAEVQEIYRGPEATLLTPPELVSDGRVGDPVTVTPGVWNGWGNGTVSSTTVLQLSVDGVSGWGDVELTRDRAVFRLPTGSVGLSARIASTAFNAGGASEEACSEPFVVLPPHGPARAFVGAVATGRALVGSAVPSGGSQAGMVLPGEVIEL